MLTQRNRDLVPDKGLDSDLDRMFHLEKRSAADRDRIQMLCDLAITGLERSYLGAGRFAHTMRGIGAGSDRAAQPEGNNLRYAIIVALGLAWETTDIQRRVLNGQTAADLTKTAVAQAIASGEMGAVALAAWAAAEVSNFHSPELFALLASQLASDQPLETVSCAWALAAALAARHLGDTSHVQSQAATLLQGEQARSGLFPHVIPASANSWPRAHIGCFADQVYPIQALARLACADNNAGALAAAEACAARIVELQGVAGQWWWHYDVRDGSVVEGFPVYSVHQHGMAPMAMLDLCDAGGTDHWKAVVKGFEWIYTHPETPTPLVSEREAVIWRKVGRREPTKVVRSVSAVTTSFKRGWHLPGFDKMFAANRVDYECRPYELGWLLYAWRSRGVVQRLKCR